MKSIHIVGETLPECWERAVVECWEQGATFPTQYDKPNDPNSRDVTLMLHIKNPMAEPRIHRAFPGGLDDLEKYRAEVMYGVHDHWVNPKEGKWEYTYHQRLFDYEVSKVHRIENGSWVQYLKINQIEKCIEMLKKCGHTRRAQAVTWMPWEDLDIADPACLQSLWFRVEKVNGVDRLNMNVRIRSNDAYKAAFMNIYAFSELQAWMAERIGVAVGELIWNADSFHIYGSYFEQFEGFLKLSQSQSLENKTFTTDFAREIFIEGCDKLLAEEDMPESKKEKVRERRKVLMDQEITKVAKQLEAVSNDPNLTIVTGHEYENKN